MPGAFDGDRPSIVTESPAKLIDRLGPKLEPGMMDHSLYDQQVPRRVGNARRASAPFERAPTLLNEIDELGPEHSVSQRAQHEQTSVSEYIEGRPYGSSRSVRQWNGGRRRLSLQERLAPDEDVDDNDANDTDRSVIESFTEDFTLREVLQSQGAIALATLYSVRRIDLPFVQVAAEREGLYVNVIPPPPDYVLSSFSSAVSEVVWVVFSQDRNDGQQLAIGHGYEESGPGSGSSVRHRSVTNHTTDNCAGVDTLIQDSAQPIATAASTSHGSNPFSRLSTCQLVSLLFIIVFICNIASYLFFFIFYPF